MNAYRTVAVACLVGVIVVTLHVGRRLHLANAAPEGSSTGGNGMPMPSLVIQHDPLAELQAFADVGRVYVVASDGSDANDGTATHPWQTLQHAADHATAGDVVRVRSGHYGEGMNLWHVSSGESKRPIRFIADADVVITHCAAKGANASLAAINIEGCGPVVIDGFTIVGDGSMQRAGIRVTGSPGCVVRHNTIDRAYIGIFVSASDDVLVEGNTCSNSTDEHGIYMGAGDRACVVRGNRLFGNNRDGLHTNANDEAPNDRLLIEANVIYGNTLSGMDIEGTTNATIRDNVVSDNRKHGIVLHSADQPNTPPCAGNRVVHNTIVDNDRFAFYVAADRDEDNLLANNVLLAGSGNGSICLAGSGNATRLRSDSNCVSDRFTCDRGATSIELDTWRRITGCDRHSIVANGADLFVDYRARDYRIRPGGPASGRADAGTDEEHPATQGTRADGDAPGVPYTNGVDIGARLR